MIKKSLPEVYSIENIRAENKGVSDFDIFPFEYFANDIERLKRSHRHEFYTFILITAGNGSHIIDFEKYDIRPGRVFLINYGQVHSWVSVRNVKGFVVFFTVDFYNIVFTGNDKLNSDRAFDQSVHYADLSEDERNEWIKTLNTVIDESLSNGIDGREIICLLLKTLVLRYNRCAAPSVTKTVKQKKKTELFFHYKKLVNKNFGRWKLPKEYTGILYVTPNYLNAVCNEVAACSATKLIRNRVVLEAKRMLTHTPLTVTQIANHLGFDDNSHFGKYFKSETGITPDGFRKEFSG